MVTTLTSSRRTDEAVPPKVGWRPNAWLSVIVSASALTMVGLSLVVRVGMTVQSVALFAHLIALVVGFGAVLTVDWHGLLWMAGRVSLQEFVLLTQRLSVPIWGGFTGLVVSGTLLSPDLSAPLTRLKLVLVLVLAVNGVQVAALSHSLSTAGGEIPARVLVRGLVSAGISQVCWWTATLIGFLNAQS